MTGRFSKEAKAFMVIKIILCNVRTYCKMLDVQAPPPPPNPEDEAGADKGVTDTFKLENLFGADIFSKADGTGQSAQVIRIDGASENRLGSRV
ncbi:hypothetical protein AK812_SmicGene29593 [Symbiodinium microadriaticum]|uniref:Uncharacterized protein n=1 Tax=Symbiodinium microadriaticum TaxID=2951 RepID=A0A1Q9D1C8_SYMMI|nr:hypothetical protein AK812_SmicGene29593 [Symbiodinium microadriaticum]